LPKVISELPPGMTANIAYDSSVFIDRSIDAVFKTIGEAMLLVLLIIFFFLRNFRATLIPLVTIPVSLIGAFALMLVLGFTINTLTLLALVLAIGLVVDDAIVVLENIYRHIEEGMPRAGGFPGRAGDRLRGRRDDHHPGRGVCAGGLHDRAHRQAVRRVRADPGRGGAGLRLRRADAVADDVLAAAQARDPARQGLSVGRALSRRLTRGYRRLLTAALARRWLVMLVSRWLPARTCCCSAR
jgi:multidrug efflux pump subunit AcrB